MNKKHLLILASLAVIALLAYIYFFPKDDGTNETAKVEKKRYIKSVYASGYVDSVNKVQIKPEVSGYIETINVKEGDRVKKGEVIAAIKNDKLQEQLREISAKRELIENRMKEDSSFLTALKDEIAIWKMNTEIERRNFERRESLYAKGIISKEDFDKSRQGLEVTEKTYAKSLEGLNDQLASLRSELDSLTASEQAVVREMEKHEIKSPVDGEVLRKFAEEGDYVNSVLKDDILFSIGNPGTLETVLSVDEEFIPLIKPGEKVLITTDAYPGKVFEGKIRVIERESDRVSRTVKVKADTDYPPDIPVGITVEANIVITDREGLFISKDAYKNGYVEVVKDGKKVRVPVEAGVEEDSFIEIKDAAPGSEETLTP
ncbi:MAG TPA: efflux RND transporter periplasmic adaptor subunit [Thermodesulfobacteriota bacterium]|nr:efflux RND transporter periplasmic adaptor subunit [Thermodesulfobacteriota bacterium]